MEIALAIAVVLLALALTAALGRRQPTFDPDQLRAAQSEALSQATRQLADIGRTQREADTALLAKQQAEFRQFAEPIGESIKRLQGEVTDLHRERTATDRATRALLERMEQGVQGLAGETASLKKALRQPHTRGSWGEVQLRRCVEMAGMSEHVDFELQRVLKTSEGTLRPDMIVSLDANRTVVVDSKVPLDAYLEALEAEDEGSRKEELVRHARHLRDHVTKLASKDYQGQFASGHTPDFVICFIPSESALHAAFEADPAAYDHALGLRVLLATPITLIGLLQTIELGWRQERIADEAQQIAESARELHGRFGRFLSEFAKVGDRLRSAVGSYNSAVGSAEARLLPQLRRIEELGATSGKEIEAPEHVDQTVRPITAPIPKDEPVSQPTLTELPAGGERTADAA